MWCALLPSSRPDSTVVVCAGRNWAALGSPFFLLCRSPRKGFSNSKMLQHLGEGYIPLAFAG